MQSTEESSSGPQSAIATLAALSAKKWPKALGPSRHQGPGCELEATAIRAIWTPKIGDLRSRAALFSKSLGSNI